MALLGLTGTSIHKGSLFGLPDIGLTEKIGQWIAKSASGYAPLTSQLGSNIFGAGTVYAQEPTSGTVYPASPETNITAQRLALQRRQSTGGGQQTGGGQPTRQPTGGGQPTGGEQPTVVVENPYDKVYSQLDALVGLLPQWQSQITKGVEDIYSTQKTGIEQALEGELAKFPGYRQQLEQRQSQTLASLAEMMRKALEAGNVYLGQFGAGSSSGAERYKYALSQAAARRGADVMAQFNQMFADLQQKEADIRNTANQQINQLGTWKATQLASIADEFQQRLYDLQAMRVNMSQREADYWMQRLSNIENNAKQWQNAITSWALQRQGELNNLKIQLGQMGQWSPSQVTYQELQQVPSFLGQAASQAQQYALPFFMTKKEKELYGLP